MERPDGSTPTFIGWALIAIGVIAAFFTSSAETISGFWLSLGIANLGVGLGVLLVSLGYLAKAIWHLPGRDVEIDAEGPVSQVNTQCDWCGKEIAAPVRPCSKVPAAELNAIARAEVSENCRDHLASRGLGKE